MHMCRFSNNKVCRSNSIRDAKIFEFDTPLSNIFAPLSNFDQNFKSLEPIQYAHQNKALSVRHQVLTLVLSILTYGLIYLTLKNVKITLKIINIMFPKLLSLS